jgi:glycosyltransferase involved in cell wall biosynthesis
VRILYLADIRFPLERANGIQSMETCHALASRGHAVAMAVRPDTNVPARDPFAFYGLPRIDGLRIEVAAVGGPPAARRTGYVTFALGRSLGRARQDLIFTRDLSLASLLLRVPASWRAPVVYEAHGIAEKTAAAMPDLLSGAEPASPAKIARLGAREARVWKHADGYVTITAGLKQELERRFGPRGHVAIVPDGVRADAFGVRPKGSGPGNGAEDATRPSALGPTDFTVGYAGHLYPWKGVDLAIEAVAALPDTRGLIVGGHAQEPDLARVKALAEQLFCSARVTFTGMVPPAEVASRLREADVLVLPNPPSAISREFTSPLKLFEYMAAGRPIVASDLPSLREVLTDGRNALLVEPGSAHALTAGIRRIKDDAALGERLAGQALADVRDYTWARRAERLEALFVEIAR